VTTAVTGTILPQQSIEVDVRFYNDDQERQLLTYPQADAIRAAVNNGVTVPTANFLTYYLFHRKRLGLPGYGNYSTIARRIDRALNHLHDSITFTGTTIATTSGVEQQLREVSEHVGEAIGLSVISHIHGLICADWQVIPEQPGRHGVSTFDFSLASNESGTIEIETKGTSVENNEYQSATVSNHKSAILAKKLQIRSLQASRNYPTSGNIRYGTIAAVDPCRNHKVRCWLLDPPPHAEHLDPYLRRILIRMRFLRDWISFVSPRSHLAAALAMRVLDLESVDDPGALDGVPLIRPNGEQYDYRPSGGQPSSFFSAKSRIVNGPVGGIVLQLSQNSLYFVGIQEELIVLSTKQEFTQIGAFRHPHPGSIRKTVRCVFTPARFDRLMLPSEIRDRRRESGGYVSLDVDGDIYYNDSGIVFGSLPLTESVG